MRIEGNVSLRPVGSTELRHQGRGQEPEQLPLAGARARVRGRAPRRGARARRAARPGDARLGRGGRPDDRRSARRRRRTTTATSPSRTCRRCARPPEWVAELRARLPELPAAAPVALRRCARPLRVRRRRADRGRGAGRLLRCGRRGRDRAEDGRQLGHRRVQPAPEPACRRGPARATASRCGRPAWPSSSGGGGGSRVGHQRQGGAGHGLRDRGVARAASSSARASARSADAGAIGDEIDAVLAEFPTQVAEYRAGKQQLFGFLVGQVMKRTAGRADARLVNEELRRQLDA